MADQEKIVLVKADIISNFINAKKDVDKFKSSIEATTAVIEDLKGEQINLKSQLARNIITQQEYEKSLAETSAKIEQYKSQLYEQTQLHALANAKLKDRTKELQSSAKSEDLINNITKNTNKSLGQMYRELNAHSTPRFLTRGKLFRVSNTKLKLVFVCFL